MTHARLAAAALAAFLAPGAALAGVVIEGKGRSEGTQRFLMEGQKLRMEGKGGKEAVVFDAGAKKMMQIDGDRKVYTEFTQGDLEQMNAMMAESRRARGAQVPKLGDVRYEKTGQREQVLGKTCDVYKVVDEARKHESELCVAPFGTFGVEKSDFAPFRAFGEFTSRMGGGERVNRTWADIPGVPLLAWDVANGKREENFRATKVEKRGVPASEFSAPAGFQKGPSFADQMKAMKEQMEKMKAMRPEPPPPKAK